MEIKEFKRALHNDLKAHNFTTLKNQERILMESNGQRIERKNLAKLIQMDTVLSGYHRSIRQVLRTSNHDSLEDLVTYYQRHEQENFTKFTYITDLNDE